MLHPTLLPGNSLKTHGLHGCTLASELPAPTSALLPLLSATAPVQEGERRVGPLSTSFSRLKKKRHCNAMTTRLMSFAAHGHPVVTIAISSWRFPSPGFLAYGREDN
jgi:hypothetical protein